VSPVASDIAVSHIGQTDFTDFTDFTSSFTAAPLPLLPEFAAPSIAEKSSCGDFVKCPSTLLQVEQGCSLEQVSG